MENKNRAPRNKTLTVSAREFDKYAQKLIRMESASDFRFEELLNKTVLGDSLQVLRGLPSESVDLLFLDPPYNQDKNFNGLKFKATSDQGYFDYLRDWFPEFQRILKPTGSVYLCGDWKNTSVLYELMKAHFEVMNRITWQREKGRGAKSNWKNASEDIWFGVKDKNKIYFDVEAVKLKRRVRAPYKENGQPKDWKETQEGKYRLTHPSNFWDDISIPYWSMPENTDHPTQKAEKLLAKLILPSCPEGGLVLDPFLGSGTTSVVAKKLNRNFIGIELNEDYAVWAEKRLSTVDENPEVQGYVDKVFWERNTFNDQHRKGKK